MWKCTTSGQSPAGVDVLDLSRAAMRSTEYAQHVLQATDGLLRSTPGQEYIAVYRHLRVIPTAHWNVTNTGDTTLSFLVIEKNTSPWRLNRCARLT
jgi:hypothetical protein